ncbi:hypothetical protein M426DRAFT_262081 [Hypoxylon sp. CI-4A]|nr:hypothetical protein M426DRAFT_262081 [Hypoxylon sp. CI-4A]
MASMAVLSFCFTLLVLLTSSFYLAKKAYAQDPFNFGGDDGDGDVIILGWGKDGSGSNGDGSSSGGYSGYSGYSGSDSGSDNGGLSVFADFDTNKAMSYRLAHGILAAICFVIIFPVGAIIMRSVKGRHTWAIHAVIQVIAFVIYVIAAALGFKLVDMVRIPPNGSSLLEMSSTNAHPIIGIVILVALVFQPQLGYMHHSKFKRIQHRTIYSHLHIWVGRIALTLGIINGGVGLRLANASEDAKIAYSVIAAVIWLLWLFIAVIREVRSGKKDLEHGIETRSYATESLAPHPGHAHYRHNSNSDDPSPPYTPGPLYGGPPVYEGGATNVRAAKDSVVDDGSVSPLSHQQIPRDDERRV